MPLSEIANWDYPFLRFIFLMERNYGISSNDHTISLHGPSHIHVTTHDILTRFVVADYTIHHTDGIPSYAEGEIMGVIFRFEKPEEENNGEESTFNQR